MKTRLRRSLAATLVCLAPVSLHAADRFWITPTGGGFGTPGLADFDWSTTNGGVGFATAPGAADVANYSLNNTYTVSFFADVTNTNLDVENGTVTFDLNGNTYLLTSGIGIDIGNIIGQTGRLTIMDGTLGTNTNGDNLRVGLAGSTGFLTVTTDGRVGDGTIRPYVFVGSEGTGTLTVNDNGRIDGSLLSIGSGSGASGSATVTGPNAVVDLNNTLFVGAGGTGTLSILNGGTVTTSSGTILGDITGADGTLTVSGTGSSLALGSLLRVGNNGDGTLTISAGGHASGTNATIGSSTNGIGTATVTGANSLWELTGLQTIGLSGVGTLTVSSGGRINSTSSASLGNTVGSEGRATVTGSGSLWSLTGFINLGSSGTGELTVSNGGEVSTGTVILGGAATGAGVLTVTGAGSRFTTTSQIFVGNLGDGTLNVNSGGEVYVTTDLNVIDPASTPLGRLNLDGGSIYVGDDFANSGAFNFSNGLLQVVGDFQPSAAAAIFNLNGTNASDLPTLDLIGSGIATNITGINVGPTHRAKLLLRLGRVLNLGTSSVSLGNLANGEGIVSVESGAQLNTTGNLSVGGVGSTAGGVGVLSITGGTVDIGALHLHSGGVINLVSGTFAVDSMPTLNGQINWSAGNFRFDTSITLDNFTVQKLLGPAATLGVGRILSTPLSGQIVSLTTPLVIDGGTLNVNQLNNFSILDIRSGSVNGPIAGNSGVVLLSHPLASYGAATNNNAGTIRGTGRITGTFNNLAAGRVEVLTGERMVFDTTASLNAGAISLIGGELQVNNTLTNLASTGLISARNGVLRFSGGLTNNGSMGFSFGTSDVFGDVTNSATGRIQVSGNSNATFYDDLINNGVTQVSLGSTAVYFGAVSGTGSFPGGGTNFFEGDLRPGASPAIINFGGNLVLGSSANTQIEIGGLLPGTQHDQLNVGGTATLNGNLELLRINPFLPVPGDQFTIINAGTRTGAFTSVTFTNPAPGITLTPVYFPTKVVIMSSTTGDKVWGVDASGNASVGSNWLGGVAPGGIGDTAAFTTIITANRIVTLDAPLTLGTAKFDDDNNYAIAGPNTLTLQNTGLAAANMTVLNAHGNGTHTISANVNAVSDVNLSQASTSAFTVSGNFSLAAGKTLAKSNSGEARFSGGQTFGNNATVTIGSGPLTYDLDNADAVSVGTNVTVRLEETARLNLAGSKSALVAGANRARVITNDSSALVNVTGANQATGRITGAVSVPAPFGAALGQTQLAASSDITVSGLRQQKLTLAAGTLAVPTKLNVAYQGGSDGLIVLNNTTANGGSGTPGLVLGADSVVDIFDNDIVLYYTGAGADPNPTTTIQGYINNFYNGATGLPVIASQGIIDTGGQTVFVAIDNGVTGFGDGAVSGTFYDLTLGNSNTSTGFNQTIVRYTWGGDYDLNGVVDALDYAIVDANLGSVAPGGVGGWQIGDGDFDGMVTALDYSPIDANLGKGGPLGGNGGGAISAIPEPSVWVLGSLAAVGLGAIGLRRKR